MCFIDSISYVASGESSGKAFQEYLNKYCNLNKIGVSSQELWEHRNAILHMTNLNSKKISKGEIKRLISYVGILPENLTLGNDAKYFSLYDLLIEVGISVGNFIDALKMNPNEFELFFKRYDEIVSDVRHLTATFID